ncbi:MAG: nucleotide sugar dehydrogenase [Mucilaginibacter sp.]|jgi:UDP-N-acetyl-D-galactosamine dehydrogenase|uniref:nucleotide sugar dehydrogenase n=1 Tax=Mucilaginibacter sp. TaxID=1882438 RepID=UPI003562346A
MTSSLTMHRIGVIGLGYVGLPLAIEFSKHYKVIGYDINIDRLNQLREGTDLTLEASSKALFDVITPVCSTATGLYLTNEVERLRQCSIFIVTVPTPVDKNNRPDLSPLLAASAMVGKVLKKNDIVIYESTVYPGVTEDECVPVLEEASGLKFNIDFFAGYSPERINPGDKTHTVTKIRKITSGSTPQAADIIDRLYSSIITAGTFKADSIKVAEAAKVIENAQRDVNIAFVNELAMIFNRLGIDTSKVLEAAGTKWNFLGFRPGLVGGHCIGVDPYYLAQKAQEAGYHPEIILAGRRINDGMGAYVADQMVRKMICHGVDVIGAEVLVLGFTFKENCPDVRNTKVIDIVRRLQEYHVKVHVHDPWADNAQTERVYDICCENSLSKLRTYDGVILAVAHDQFKQLDIASLAKPNAVVYDLKACLPDSLVNARL